MVIHLSSDAFVAQCTYDERLAPKAAGFWFHGKVCGWRGRGSCPGCANKVGVNVWYTTKPEVAIKLAAYCDQEAKAALLKREESVQASKATDYTEKEIPRPVGLEYMPFQRAGIHYMNQRRNVLLSDDMGLGKSIQAIGRVNCELSPKSVLILCPASLKINWAREWKKWTVHPGLGEPFIVEDEVSPTANVAIVNYDRLFSRPARWETVFKKLADYIRAGVTKDDGKNQYTDGNGMLRPSIFDQLMARRWDFIIADEAHFVRHPSAKRSKAVLGVKAKNGKPGARGLRHVAEHFLALTGTPILNRPAEIWPLLNAIDDKEWGDFFSFAKRYCDAHRVKIGRNKFAWDFTGASNLSELQEKLRANCMVRRLKKDVLSELPPKRRQIIPLVQNGAAEVIKAELDDYQSREGKIEILRAQMELADASDDDLEYKRLAAELNAETSAAFTQMAGMRHAVAVKKIPVVIEHIQGLLEEGLEKVVVFAWHKDMVAALTAEFGAAAVQLTGETPMADRQAAVDRFQKDPTCKVFVGNIIAAGVGLTLTAASTVVFAEIDWVPANVTQAEDRCHRIGQLDQVLVQHLVFDGSLDARMVQAIIDKQEIADRALDRDAPKPEVPILPPQMASAPQPKQARKWPEATPAEREAAQFAMQAIAGVCDGARKLDGVGFSAADAYIGHRLAHQPTPYTDGQVFLAKRLARKYHRQLSGDVLSALGVEK